MSMENINKITEDSDERTNYPLLDDASESKQQTNTKRRIIDESQLNDDEVHRLATRRAYNRQCAAKARKKSKDLISSLQDQVRELIHSKAKLERLNDVLKAQMKLLEQQNQSLMINQRLTGGTGLSRVFAGTTGQTPSGYGKSGLPFLDGGFSSHGIQNAKQIDLPYPSGVLQVAQNSLSSSQGAFDASFYGLGNSTY